jgi:pimeloyl-ACP methyl ester carboxylesterase
MNPSNRRVKWLLASAFFSVIGGVVIVVLLWTARGRTTAQVSQRDTPLREEVVHFEANGNSLTGVLVRPTTPGPHPAIVFVNGSGDADRTGHGVFPHLWRHFARQGFACLSWDRPGVGQSSGDFETQSFADRAEETLAAVAWLRSRSDIRKNQVGLWGFSQGAAVAPLAASESADIAFVIEVSGHQLPTWQQDLYRVEAELKADGFSKADIAKALEIARLRMDLIRGSGPFEELDETQKQLMGRPWFAYVHPCDRKRFESGQRTVHFDPGPCWEKVRCPVLAIHGDRDTSTPTEQSVAVVRAGLQKGGNADLTVKVFAKADHRISVSETGGRKEADRRANARAAEAGPEFAPGYLDTMSGWLVERFAPKR